MDHVVVPPQQEPAERREPAEIGVVGGIEGVDRGPARQDLGNESVLAPQHVGHFVVHLLTIGGGHHVHQQALGSAVTQALDDLQDPERPTGRPGRQPLFHGHLVILPVGNSMLLHRRSEGCAILSLSHVGVNDGPHLRAERVTHSMTLPTPSDGGASSAAGEVSGVGGTTSPVEPPSHLVYVHRARLVPTLRELWASRDIIYTLAERDIRAQYKQATLGLLWALIAPLAMLGIFTIIFSRTASLGIPGIPYPIFAYLGILCWTFFSGSLGTGGVSLLSNNALMSKTQFPRECFPLETVGVQAVNSVISWIPLVLLFVFYHFMPKPHHGVGAALDAHRACVRDRGDPRRVRTHHPDARPGPGAADHHFVGTVRHARHLAVQAASRSSGAPSTGSSSRSDR